ncbi:hypothetical protein CSA56_18020 [candidate division KSB3 bacterium]|uniref:TIGR00374 family protein n=1 Tax=candidate division KSB3 bacterium TaxID=2044937 RepID=A0A2G6K9S1_9BACT|nr:MAG: hypothetical protein CSA56_18020 [candidate division KSB3 bacterium]
MFASVSIRKHFSKLFSLGLGIFLVIWLLSQLDLADTFAIIRDIPLSFLGLGAVCYVVSFAIRTLRFRMLLAPDQQRSHLFPIVLVHYTALTIIPARLGELSYVYLLKKFNNVPTGHSLSSLLLARVFDHIAISTLFLCASFFIDLQTQWLKTTSIFVGIGLVVSVLLLIALLTYKEICVAWLRRVLETLRFDRYSLIRRVMHELDNIVSALQGIHLKQHLGSIFGLSLMIWLCIFGVNYALLQSFDVTLTYIEVAFASTFMILLGLIPLQLLGGVGVRQTAWTFIALALGVSKNNAIVSAFGTHIASVMFLFVFGLYGLWRMWRLQTLHREPAEG